MVALTATVGNAEELADWLGCTLVNCHKRDVDLHQEIWASGQAFSVTFGQEEGQVCHVGTSIPSDPVDVVNHLLTLGRGPVLVFTESRQEAIDLAERYSQRQPRTPGGIIIAEQLELFSEPTESSQQLQRNAQKKVAFHTADLTAQERQVLEDGFSTSSFDVYFATSTLAAGVNFPFRSVVFPKLTYQFGERQGRMIPRSDYRNMSGRAGRLGLHDNGYAVLLARTPRELQHANGLVLPINDNIESKFVGTSMRKTVLCLIASQIVSTKSELSDFFKNTFYWYQIQERNPRKLDDVIASSSTAADWLLDCALLEIDQGYILPTPLGRAVAQSGLLPSTAVDFIKIINAQKDHIDANFEQFSPGLLHWICQCGEFRGDRPARFLPFPSRGVTSSSGFLQTCPLIAPLNRTDNQVNQSTHAMVLFSRGEIERVIRHHTNISSGQTHRLALDVSWVIDGLRRITSVPELAFSQSFSNKMSMLARQVQWGAPVEALDILRVAQREGVPGFGRQRALALLRSGISTFDQLLSQAMDALSSLLGSDRRASALLQAVTSSLGISAQRFRSVHVALAAKLGITSMIDECSDALGTDYERAIEKLLKLESTWSVHVLDDGRQQNVPDIMLVHSDLSVIIECKTASKKPPIIGKEDAFAVVQKSCDYDQGIRRITLGKPIFDEQAKKKAYSAKEISLLEHDIFVEGFLRLRSGEITPSDFLHWISTAGVVELERLGGRASYELVRE